MPSKVEKMRVLFALFALLSLASAQCGGSCSCGNSACCQNSYSSPYTLFNLAYGQQNSYGQVYGSNVRQNFIKSSCLKVNPIPVSLAQVARNSPIYTRVIENNEGNRQVDNICTTYFPLPDDSSTFVAYYSVVYTDGSNRLTTTIATDVGAGTCLRGNAYYSYTQRLFASLGNNLFIGCNRDDYGENDQVRVYAVTFGSVSPLGGSCVQQIQSVIQCVGQGEEDGLYVLPYRRPTRCVTQQVCSLFNPLLYSTGTNPNGANFNRCSNGRCY